MQYQQSNDGPRPVQRSAHLGDEPSLTERFEAFHGENPHVYDALVRLARRYFQATGETKQSVQRLVEIARWDEKIRTHGAGSFELNNDFGAFYARLIMLLERDLRGVFQLRKAPEADAWIEYLRLFGEAA